MRINSNHSSLSVALVSPEWPPSASHNGIVASLSKLTPALKAQGARVFVFAESHYAATDLDTLSVDVIDVADMTKDIEKKGLLEKVLSRISPIDALAKRRARQLAHVLQNGIADSVELIEIEEAFGTSFYLQKRIGLPVVLRLHGPAFLTGQAKGVANDRHFRNRVAIEGRAFRAAPAVSSPSAFALREACQYYCHEPPLSRVIPNAQPIPPSPERWRPGRIDRQHMVFIGRLDRVKGADLAIDAFQSIAADYPNATLTFAGPDSGIQTTARTLEKFESYAARRISTQFAGRVRFLGTLSPAQVSALRRDASIVLVCSRYETFPNTLLEAMAQACPVITSDAGGIPEIVEHTINALVFQSGSSRSLSECMRYALDNPIAMQKIAENAVSHCATAFSPHAIAAETLSFYSEVLAEAKLTDRACAVTSP